jgi:hypothetical protein
MFLIKRPHAEETVRKALDDPPNPYRKKQHASASDHPSGLISERPAHGPLHLFRSLAEGRVSSDLEAGFHNTRATHRMLALGTPIVPQPYCSSIFHLIIRKEIGAGLSIKQFVTRSFMAQPTLGNK